MEILRALQNWEKSFRYIWGSVLLITLLVLPTEVKAFSTYPVNGDLNEGEVKEHAHASGSPPEVIAGKDAKVGKRSLEFIATGGGEVACVESVMFSPHVEGSDWDSLVFWVKVLGDWSMTGQNPHIYMSLHGSKGTISKPAIKFVVPSNAPISLMADEWHRIEFVNLGEIGEVDMVEFSIYDFKRKSNHRLLIDGTHFEKGALVLDFPVPSQHMKLYPGEALYSGVIGLPYSGRLYAFGGMPPYRWSLAGGSLPDGTTLEKTGAIMTISGRPTASGTFKFKVKLEDSAGNTIERDVAIVIEENVEVPAEELTKKVMEARYGPKIPARVEPELSFVDKPDIIVVSGQMATLKFAKRSCSLKGVTVRGRDFPGAHFGDVVIVDNSGKEFRQSDARDGTLTTAWSKSGNFLELSGLCTPVNRATGIGYPGRLYLRYLIHKVTGFTLVEVTLKAPDNSPLEVCRLTIENSLADGEAERLDELWYWPMFPWEDDKRFMGPQRYYPDVFKNRRDQILSSERRAFGIWGNGAVGFQVLATDYKGSEIDEAYAKKSDVDKYLTIKTKGGHRAIDMTFINKRPGSASFIEKQKTFTYAFSLLPFRKYRPRIEFIEPLLHTRPTKEAEAKILEMVRRGTTTVNLSNINVPDYDIMLGNDTGTNYVPYMVKLGHKYGLKVIPSFQMEWFKPRWPIQRGMFGYTKDNVLDDKMEQAMPSERMYGIPAGDWPKGETISTCLNAPHWRKVILEATRMVTDECGADGVYLDGGGQNPCGNTRHGDSTDITFLTLGQLRFAEDIQKILKGDGEDRFVNIHVTNNFDSPLSLIDFNNPGEESKTRLPAQAGHDLVYTSLLYGSQVLYYTGAWGVPRTTRTYEYALSRCGILWVWEPDWDLFHKYMSSLETFNVDDSVVHHPFDSDYGTYAKTNIEEVTPVIYSRDGDALVVVVMTKGLPAPSSDEATKREECQEHLRQLGEALKKYAQDHGGRFPDGGPGADSEHPYNNPQTSLIEAIYPDYISDPKVFYCPSATGHDLVPLSWSEDNWKKGYISYQYFGRYLKCLDSTTADPKKILMSDYCLSWGGNHETGYGNALFVSGQVKWCGNMPLYLYHRGIEEIPDYDHSSDLQEVRDRADKDFELTLNTGSLGIKSEKILVYNTISGNAQEIRTDSEGLVTVKNLEVGKGPQVLRIKSVPQSPEVIWHDHIVWRIVSSSHSSPTEVGFEIAGVPVSTGVIFVYCGNRGKPTRITGGELISYRDENKMAKVRVNFPHEAMKEVIIVF